MRRTSPRKRFFSCRRQAVQETRLQRQSINIQKHVGPSQTADAKIRDYKPKTILMHLSLFFFSFLL